MTLNELHKMLHEALVEIEESGETPSRLVISDRYKDQLLKEREQYIKDEYHTILRYRGVPVKFANLDDNIHFYITL